MEFRIWEVGGDSVCMEGEALSWFCGRRVVTDEGLVDLQDRDGASLWKCQARNPLSALVKFKALEMRWRSITDPGGGGDYGLCKRFEGRNKVELQLIGADSLMQMMEMVFGGEAEEIQRKKEQGFCYRCDAKYGPRHRCGEKQFHILLKDEEQLDDSVKRK
ncbi:hypothetical protein K2173_014053 [Erythroxylum novogranatense]|uniref:Uncharacterized protein n=1 Tax=Erythroxylum novogranatense TaxID=1862640 RepID=A0AAV8SDL9_9ROSI|nr:hypothetical protein K2173_014053 [Erythroxylum novogranatense]